MKTSTSTLNIVQLAQPNREGLYPIVLRAHWQGGIAEKRTGVAIPKSAWNKRSSKIAPSYPNAKSLNAQILEYYQDALNRKLLLEKEGPLSDVKEIFSSGEVRNRLDYKKLMEGLISDRALAYTSAKKLRCSYNTLCQFMENDTFRITDLQTDRIAAYGRWLQSVKKLKNGTIKDHLYDISNVWTYAITQRLVDPTTNPFITFCPKMVYPVEIRKKAITEDQLDTLRAKLHELTMKHVMENSMEVFSNIYSDEFTLAMYVLGYYFGGLALVDMANLRKDKMEVVQEGVLNYYVFRDVQRQKTNRPVPLIVKSDLITRPLIEYYMETPGEYLFPINDHTGTPEEQLSMMNTVSRTINYHIRKLSGLDITYYSCRHSYATHYLNTEGSNPLHLAAMMGRSPAGIFRYVKTIQSDEDIIRERSRMGL